MTTTKNEHMDYFHFSHAISDFPLALGLVVLFGVLFLIRTYSRNTLRDNALSNIRGPAPQNYERGEKTVASFDTIPWFPDSKLIQGICHNWWVGMDGHFWGLWNSTEESQDYTAHLEYVNLLRSHWVPDGCLTYFCRVIFSTFPIQRPCSTLSLRISIYSKNQWHFWSRSRFWFLLQKCCVLTPTNSQGAIWSYSVLACCQH